MTAAARTFSDMGFPAFGGIAVEVGVAEPVPVGEELDESGRVLADITRSTIWMSPLLVLSQAHQYRCLGIIAGQAVIMHDITYRTLGLMTFASLNQISLSLIVTRTVTLAIDVNS